MCAHKPELIMNITNKKNIQIRIYRFTAIIIIIMLLLLLNTYKFRIVKNYNESNFSPEIKEIAKFPSDKRIINRVVFDCSLMMNRKSKKVDYVWGEYSLKK